MLQRLLMRLIGAMMVSLSFRMLKHIGFTVKLKPYIQRSDGSAKGDWDVGIAIDVMEMAREVDTVILLSGDGDFDLLLEKVKKIMG